MGKQKQLWDRSQHCWFKVEGGPGYRCHLCGVYTRELPSRPPPPDWMPERYDPLTDAERAMIPVGAGPGD